MNIFIANHVLLLSCVLAAVGWVVSFAGLCVSAAGALTHAVSWWITVYELSLVILVCTVIWSNAIEIYRPVVLALIAISVPYATGEIAHYITTGQPALSAASAGYIVLVVAQFSWLFLFGVRHESLIFQTLRVPHPSYSYTTNRSNAAMAFGTGTSTLDMAKSIAASTYPPAPPPLTSGAPAPYDSHPTEPADQTVFVSPHAEYNIPVIALHTYEANPEDPNELKFSKGETLYVHEQKGNWWQARKADGTASGGTHTPLKRD
ncbi:hypothetical protein BDB00DRAFT_878316 [Zychaea mexicana]|uniref:uncharacterized protein n=1 Tax=Zychaea mexicana TaxID=64656 RepID=UPI0022FDC209|nr:uncharacterized protein BDB00DRAFT_878316 [Zychaea mexicana]KAI9484900.1 hypothetical protein BDB00DRAFT_878316 [Zychaea mexicana]